MDLATIKKYPSQISTAFKRFPLASAMAFFTFIALVTNTEFARFGNDHFTRLFLWLAIYPIAAILVALATSLVQESRKSTNARPQAIASGTWFLLSIALVAGLPLDDDPFYFGCTVTLVYLIVEGEIGE